MGAGRGLIWLVLITRHRFRRPSVDGLCQSAASPAGVVVHHALQDLRRRGDLGFGRLQNGVLIRAGPGGERLAEVAVVGVFGRDCLALAVGKFVGEYLSPGGQVFDPLVHLPWLLLRSEGELVALRRGGGLGFGRPQRRVVLAGVAAAQLGGGGGQVPLLAGGLLQSARSAMTAANALLTLPVGLLQGLVAGRQRVLPAGFLMVTALLEQSGRRRRRAGRPGGHPPSHGADLPQFVADVWRGPGGLDRVGVAQV